MEDWFKAFYESDYFRYRFEPRLDEVPTEEVDFIVRHGALAPGGSTLPRVFDICCGIGRHTRPLAARGCDVVGVDLSGRCIQTARALAMQQGLEDRCRFDEADIRHYTPPSNCDLAINIFTSFGYFADEREDTVVLTKAYQSLRPGGRLILDTINREAAVAGHRKRERRGGRGNYVIQETRVALDTGRMECDWTFVHKGQQTRHHVSIRLYALHELVRLASASGLCYLGAFGDFHGNSYNERSPRCILLAERPAQPSETHSGDALS